MSTLADVSAALDNLKAHLEAHMAGYKAGVAQAVADALAQASAAEMPGMQGLADKIAAIDAEIPPIAIDPAPDTPPTG